MRQDGSVNVVSIRTHTPPIASTSVKAVKLPREGFMKASGILIRNLKAQKVKQTQVGKFVAWFLNRGKRIVTIQECAEFLSSIIIDKDITDKRVQGIITLARKTLEEKKGMSIWNVRGEGYRIASEKEKAVFLCRTTRTVLKNAERAARLYVITDKKLIPQAVQEVYGNPAKAQLLYKDSHRKLQMIMASQKALIHGN